MFWYLCCSWAFIFWEETWNTNLLVFISDMFMLRGKSFDALSMKFKGNSVRLPLPVYSLLFFNVPDISINYDFKLRIHTIGMVLEQVNSVRILCFLGRCGNQTFILKIFIFLFFSKFINFFAKLRQFSWINFLCKLDGL